jgi:hypothetical protein
MPHAVLIVGLCGSGKSQLAQDYASQGYVCLDESFEGRRFAADSEKNLSTDKFNELKRQLALGRNCVFTEAMLMFEKERQAFEPCLKQLYAMIGVTVEWVFFANDLEAANHNCRNDPNRKDPEGAVLNNGRWTGHYQIPAGHTARPIFRILEKKTKVSRILSQRAKPRGGWAHFRLPIANLTPH